jgi:BlaI family transcriptional regulator, penicillinase repressor
MRKPGPPPEIPPPLELECLKALWNLGEGNVKDVREVLTRDRNLAYTTVMTVLDRLEKRGRVARRKQGRFFVYSPAVSRETLRQFAIEALVDDFFDGSRDALIRYLDGKASEPITPTTPATALDPTLL